MVGVFPPGIFASHSFHCCTTVSFCVLATCSKYYGRGLPTTFFPYIATLKVFSTNSLCPTVCPIHEWCLLVKFFKIILPSSTLWKISSFFTLSVLLFLTFFSNSMFQIHLHLPLHFFPRSLFLIHKVQHSKYKLLISLFFYFQTKIIRSQMLLFIIKHNFSFVNSLYCHLYFFHLLSMYCLRTSNMVLDFGAHCTQCTSLFKILGPGAKPIDGIYPGVGSI